MTNEQKCWQLIESAQWKSDHSYKRISNEWSKLSEDEFYFDSKKYNSLSAQLLALPEFTKTTRKTKTSSLFDDTTYYIWTFTGV